MKINVDTNVLVRAIVADNAAQARLAQAELAQAETIVLTIPVLCELVWVLSQGYKIDSAQIVETVKNLVDSANVVVNRPTVEAGLALLEAGGDFADGAIAYEGSWLGADEFVSFDRKAVKLLKAQSRNARVPGSA
ncbi:MAG: PIN domain-containing protein [Dokdonella sp.]|nr:MAG: PIN domain-containing protein [Gammaproteobacteria bacterium]TXI76880.1 MAG: PIN domain-containing protein [Dokdonella sp.]